MSLNFRIPYTSELHPEILAAIQKRVNLSRDSMSKYYTKWTEIENRFLAYLPESETTRIKKQLRKEGKPQYATMQIPYSYAMMMSAHTYLTTVFLSRSPIFQFAGRHGEPEQKVRSIEAVMDYQRQVGEMMVPLYIWLYDAKKYGLGVIGQYWDDQIIRVSTIEEQEPSGFGSLFGGKRQKVRKTQEIQGYNGNRLYNVKPQDFFPDPRVPLWRLQDGEFCGRLVDVSWNTILNGAAQGLYFNLDELRKHRASNRSSGGDPGSAQMNLPQQDLADMKDMGNVKLMEMYVELVPSEWRLGGSKYPEKWVFVVANDAVIIAAQPYDAMHGKFPFFTMEPEMNGYSFINRSPLAVIEDLQYVMDWLINSHFYNVRKSLNDQFVVDPSRVEMVDVEDTGPGNLWRLTPAAYGTDPRLAVHQMVTNDVTRQNIGDAKMMHELMQLVTGVNSDLQGQSKPSSRRSAQEVRTTSTFGVGRMKTEAEFLAAQGFAPMASVLLQQTQQNYSSEQVFRLAGPRLAGKNPFVNVTPETIAGMFDFIPIDGTMPVDKLALANTWKELLGYASKIPEVATKYDLGRMLEYTMDLGGAKNVDQFRIEVVPDEQMDQEVAKGNSIPMNPGTSETIPGPAPISGEIGRLQ